MRFSEMLKIQWSLHLLLYQLRIIVSDLTIKDRKLREAQFKAFLQATNR